MRGRYLLSGWLVFVVCWGCWSTEVAAKPNQTQRCLRKRDTCKKRCLVKAVLRERKCRKDVLKRRNRCIKEAHKNGRRCVRKLECSDADKCYANCKDKNDPVLCYNKEGCGTMKEKCYATCQNPLGEALKSCLKETQDGIRTCEQDKTRWTFACQSSCPTCN